VTKWDRMVAKAEKELRRSSEAIKASSRGVPSGKRSDWKVGKNPGSLRGWR
jgi:hypothetical protein